MYLLLKLKHAIDTITNISKSNNHNSNNSLIYQHLLCARHCTRHSVYTLLLLILISMLSDEYYFLIQMRALKFGVTKQLVQNHTASKWQKCFKNQVCLHANLCRFISQDFWRFLYSIMPCHNVNILSTWTHCWGKKKKKIQLIF